jgi:serine/threonine protein phosphatase PrpC
MLLCSDGLYGGTPLGGIQRVLGSKPAPKRIAQKLVALALEGKADDNISAVVIAVGGARSTATTPRPSSGARAPRPSPRARVRQSPRA